MYNYIWVLCVYTRNVCGCIGGYSTQYVCVVCTILGIALYVRVYMTDLGRGRNSRKFIAKFIYLYTPGRSNGPCQDFLSNRAPRAGLSICYTQIRTKIVPWAGVSLSWSAEKDNHTREMIPKKTIEVYICTTVHFSNCRFRFKSQHFFGYVLDTAPHHLIRTFESGILRPKTNCLRE